MELVDDEEDVELDDVELVDEELLVVELVDDPELLDALSSVVPVSSEAPVWLPAGLPQCRNTKEIRRNRPPMHPL